MLRSKATSDASLSLPLDAYVLSVLHLVSEEATDKRQAATAAAGQIEYILFLLFPLDFDKKVLPAWAGADNFFAVCTRLNTKGMLRAQKHVLQYRTWAEVAQTSSGSNLHTFSHSSFRGEGGEASPLMLMILLPPLVRRAACCVWTSSASLLAPYASTFFPKVSPRVPNVMLLYSQGLSFLSPFFWLGGHGLARGADSLRR